MNCKNLIVAGFNTGVPLLNQYVTGIYEVFDDLNTKGQNKMIVVSQQEFAEQVTSNDKNVGVCIAGSGVPECNLLNKCKGIRAAVVHTKYLAEMCRKHNDANVIIISTDCIAEKLSSFLVKSYLLSAFDNEERNMIRIQKMKDLQVKYGQK